MLLSHAEGINKNTDGEFETSSVIEKIDPNLNRSDDAIKKLENEVSKLKMTKKEFEQNDNPNFDNLSQTRQGNNSTLNNSFDEGNAALLEILRRQNTITQCLVNNQQKGMLPKKELQCFDGADVTKFKMFMNCFERQIERSCDDDADRLYYLLQHTKGKAKKLVESCTHYDASVAYGKAKYLLICEYGNEFKVSNSYIEKLEKWPVIRNDDVKALEDLSLYLLDCYHYLENMSSLNQLQNPKEIMNIVAKLPYKLRDRWRRKCHYLLTKNRNVLFKDLVDFVQEEAAVLNHPVFSSIEGTVATKTKTISRPRGIILSTQKVEDTKSTQDSVKYCEYCKKDNHYISSCKYYREISHKLKTEFIRKASLCFACLRKNHMSKDCQNKATCRICKLQHPTILHIYKTQIESSNVNGENFGC